ncbi:MAG TPA: DUF4328 domain-containing protein [Pyrinomonadaceae bacterium]|nr:DUF4328 domain-containing protein [Pyrinomonadaceae bacterium]
MNPSPISTPFISAHDFTSGHGRATIVKVLLIVGAVATGMSILADALSFVFPPVAEDQEVGENLMGAALMLVTLLLMVLELIIYVTTVVFFCMWLHRVYKNLRAFNSWARLEHSPGWAVGSFFVPFANLVIPYRAVKEVWVKSGPPGEAYLSEPDTPARFPVWWTFWLAAAFSGNISMRVSLNENIPQETATLVSIIAGLLSLVAAVFAYLVVDAIDKRQKETSAKLQLEKIPGPPPPPPNLSMPDVLAPP